MATKFKIKMKKSILAVVFLALLSLGVKAQDDDNEIVIVPVYDRFDDKLILEITNDMWLDLPQDVKLRGFSPGFKAYFFSDYTFGRESNFSFAWGLGISADNVHSNAAPYQFELPDGSLSEQKLTPFPEEYEYEKNKLVTTYLELPLELRFITKGRRPFKFAAGFRLGYLLADHQKIIDTDGKRKYYDFNDITTWRYGVSARIGVGKIQATAFYSLVPLIEGQDQIIPFSIGLAFTPFR